MPAIRRRSASPRITTSACRPSSEPAMAWRHPRVTVDGLVVVQGKLVAVRRANEPFRGMPALPGGFVELGETVAEAVVREVREETGLETKVVRFVGVFSDPNGVPRGDTVAIAVLLGVI